MVHFRLTLPQIQIVNTRFSNGFSPPISNKRFLDIYKLSNLTHVKEIPLLLSIPALQNLTPRPTVETAVLRAWRCFPPNQALRWQGSCGDVQWSWRNVISSFSLDSAYTLDLGSSGAWHSLKNETQSGNHTNQFWRMLASLCFLIGMLDRISCAVPKAWLRYPAKLHV